MKKILLLIPPIIIFRCAALGPPPGGPKDETSPTLVNVSPESGTTGIEGGIALSRGLPIDQRDLRAYSTSHGRNASGRMDCDDAGR